MSQKYLLKHQISFRYLLLLLWCRKCKASKQRFHRSHFHYITRFIGNCNCLVRGPRSPLPPWTQSSFWPFIPSTPFIFTWYSFSDLECESVTSKSWFCEQIQHLPRATTHLALLTFISFSKGTFNFGNPRMIYGTSGQMTSWLTCSLYISSKPVARV